MIVRRSASLQLACIYWDPTLCQPPYCVPIPTWVSFLGASSEEAERRKHGGNTQASKQDLARAARKVGREKRSTSEGSQGLTAEKPSMEPTGTSKTPRWEPARELEHWKEALCVCRKRWEEVGLRRSRQDFVSHGGPNQVPSAVGQRLEFTIELRHHTTYTPKGIAPVTLRSNRASLLCSGVETVGVWTGRAWRLPECFVLETPLFITEPLMDTLIVLSWLLWRQLLWTFGFRFLCE